MTDYTPTTEQVRDVWAAWSDYGGLTSRPRSGTSDDSYAEFDRWLADMAAKRDAQWQHWVDNLPPRCCCGNCGSDR